MLHILLITLPFLFCKAINHANIAHLTLALLPVLAAVNVIDDAPIPFANYIIISLTSLMIADLASKTTLAISQPSNAIETPNTKALMNEPGTSNPAYSEAQNVDIAPVNTAPTNHNLHTTLKTYSNTRTPPLLTSSPTVQTSDSNPSTAADRVASLKKSLHANTPRKPVPETDIGVFPFYYSSMLLGKAELWSRFPVLCLC